MELSAISLDNAVAKTAGLLRDELDIEPGDVIGIHVPTHWQRAVWFGACAATGAIFAPDADPADCTVLVIDRDHLDLVGTARDDVLVSLEPFGLPSREPVPSGVIEHAVAARAYPDVFVPHAEPADTESLLRSRGVTLTAGEVMAAASTMAVERALSPGARCLVLPEDPDRDLAMLALPLALGGSSVLVRHPDAGSLAAILLAEGVSTPGPT